MTSSNITLEVATFLYKAFNIREVYLKNSESEINDFGEYNAYDSQIKGIIGTSPRNQGCFRKFANSRVLETSLLWKAISCDIFTQMRLLNASWVGNWLNCQIKS